MTNGNYLDEHNISGISFCLEHLVPELRAFGEEKTAEWLATLDEETHASVSRLALTIMLRERTFVDKAIALAAVEIFEGSLRPLRRRRRFYGKKNR